MAARRPDEPGPRTPLEGRLDLDALDAGHDDLLDLDVIGEERATLGDRIAALDVPGRIARHRTAATAVGVVVVLLLVSAGVWWVRRPAPLGDPRITARAAGEEPTAALVADALSGKYDAVQQQLLVVSGEAPGVDVRLLGVSGPGLTVDNAATGIALPADSADRAIAVGSRLACVTPEATTAALSSGPDDYTLVVQRTSTSGEERVDRVPVVGSSTLADLVHRGCLQIAIDRDLLVTSVTARPYPGMATLALDVGLFNPSPRVWTGLHIAASAQPVVVNNGLQVALEPGTSGDLRAQFWPDDCADPVGALREGIAVEADLGPSGQAPSLATTTSVLLRLPGQMLDDVAKAAVAMCGTTPPRGTVEWARLREGGGNGSGGVIDLGLSLTTPGAGIVEVDHLGDGSASVGELFAYESPAHSVDGVASIKLQWRLPSCRVLLRDGLPRLHVVLAGDVRRPYLVPLAGDDLRAVLYRLCGSEVADLVG